MTLEVFPESITRTLTRSVVSQRVQSSAQRRWQQRRQTLHRPFYTFDLDSENLTQSQTDTLNDFFIAHEFQEGSGGDDAFLLKDPEDNERTDESLGTGDGSEKEFTIKATYSYGSKSVTVLQGHTIPGSETIYLNGSPVSTSDYTIDNTTGLVTFDTAPGNGVQVNADYQFRRKCIFNDQNLDFDIPNAVTRDVSYQIVEVPT